MADTRLQTSAMPAHLVPIHDRIAPQMFALVEQVFTEVTAAGEGRDPDELVNDALSLQSQMAAYAALAFITNLRLSKGIPLAVAHSVGGHDLRQRIDVAVFMADTVEQAPGANRQ